MKLKRRIKQVKTALFLSKLTKKSLSLGKAYKGSKKLKQGLDDFLTPKYKR